MSSDRVKQIITGLFILWLFFVLASFFAVQKPFSAANAQALGHALLDLLTAGWLAVVALAVGAWLLTRLLPTALSPDEKRSRLEVVILGAGLGFGVLGFVSFAVGLLGLLRPVVAYGVTITLTVIFAPQLLHFIRRRATGTKAGIGTENAQNFPFPLSRLLSTVYLVSVFGLTLLVALLPPSDWDGLFYHLTGPKLYLQAGRVAGGIDIPHLSFPALMEMLYAWAMLLRGDIAAKLLHTLFAFLLAGLVYLTARRFLSQKSAWLAVLVLASMPMVGALAGWAYNDLALAFYQLASLYAIINYQHLHCDRTGEQAQVLALNNEKLSGQSVDRSREPESARQQRDQIPNSTIHNSQFTIRNSKFSWLILSGVFAGLAMGLKYTSFVTPLVIGGLILWQSYRQVASGRWQVTGGRWQVTGYRSQVSGIRSQVAGGKSIVSRFTFHVSRLTLHVLRSTGLIDFMIFALVTSLVALPWYLKNWAFTGNPVYPFLFDVFGGQYWDTFRAGWYAAAQTGIGFQPGTLLALPWLLTLGVRDANYWDGRTGPLFLLFLPFIVGYGLFRYRRQAARWPAAWGPLLIYALAQFAFWALGVIWSRSLWQSRLFLPGLAALAPVAGWVWADLSQFDLPRFSLSRFVNLAIGLTLALTVIDMGLLTLKINPLPYLTGLETRDAYLTRRLGTHYAAMQQINETLPAEAVVTFLWEPRSYFCRVDCRPDSILDEFPHLVYQHGSAAAIAQAWQQAGVTHVLIHRTGLDFLRHNSPETVNTAILTELETNALHLEFDVEGSYQLYALEPKP